MRFVVPAGGYLLNRDHLAAPAVLVLAGMRSELLRRIGEFTDQWEVAPLLLGTFGSFARRDGDADSDIDFLLVAKAKNSDEQAGNLAVTAHTATRRASIDDLPMPQPFRRELDNVARKIRTSVRTEPAETGHLP